METSKCPLCKSPCIIKVVATESEKWCEVDVCKLCGTMYPRGRDVVKVNIREEPKKKAAKPKKTAAKKKR
ncbi:MAG TPA: hypothetical protein VGB78_05155 [Thermoplasmata archaeon]|jgi:hypothetical protein